MTKAALVLVVAPDRSFQRSLEFALEAEGFVVDTHDRMSKAFVSQRSREAACAVVDDAAVEDWRLLKEEFSRFGKPIVLLIDRAPLLSDLPGMATLTKPFLGAPLIEAVCCAIARVRTC